jgi:hypothetical protein
MVSMRYGNVPASTQHQVPGGRCLAAAAMAVSRIAALKPLTYAAGAPSVHRDHVGHASDAPAHD